MLFLQYCLFVVLIQAGKWALRNVYWGFFEAQMKLIWWEQNVAGITSRRICCCVATHWLLRRDASETASWRNFSSLRASGAAYADETMFFIAQVHTFHWADTSDCAGLKIRLRWLEDSIALAWRYDFVVSKIRIRKQNETDLFAEWSGWVSWMKWLC